MAGWPVQTANAPVGLQPDPETVRVVNRTGSATVVGEIVQFDLSSVTTEVTTLNNGETGIFGSVITPTTAYLRTGWFAVCKEIAADNAEMSVVVRGKVRLLGGDNPAVGASLIAQNGEIDLTDTAGAAGQKILAIAIEAGAGSNPQLIWTVFDGIYGFGASNDQ